jgi:hypothetical protein
VKKIVLIITFLMILCPFLVYSWNGIDSNTDSYIEIDDADISSVRPGDVIRIYDFKDRSYHDAKVISVTKADPVEIEVYDNNTGDYRTFEIE